MIPESEEVKKEHNRRRLVPEFSAPSRFREWFEGLSTDKVMRYYLGAIIALAVLSLIGRAIAWTVNTALDLSEDDN